MASSDDSSWQAATGMWRALDPGQHGFVAGYIASKDAALVAEAVQACMTRPGRDVGMEVRQLEWEDVQGVLLILCDRLPAAVAQALDDYKGA